MCFCLHMLRGFEEEEKEEDEVSEEGWERVERQMIIQSP